VALTGRGGSTPLRRMKKAPPRRGFLLGGGREEGVDLEGGALSADERGEQVPGLAACERIAAALGSILPVLLDQIEESWVSDGRLSAKAFAAHAEAGRGMRRVIEGEGMLTPGRPFTWRGERLEPNRDRVAPDHEVCYSQFAHLLRPAYEKEAVPSNYRPLCASHHMQLTAALRPGGWHRGAGRSSKAVEAWTRDEANEVIERILGD
jgi:hypothetical protein